MNEFCICGNREQLADELLELITKYGATARVVDVIVKERAVAQKKNNEALYHLMKISGYYKEVERHVDALARMGIKLMSVDDSKQLYAIDGIEKFGLPLNSEGRAKYIEHMGVEVWQ